MNGDRKDEEKKRWKWGLGTKWHIPQIGNL